MPVVQPKPAQRIANAVITILVICAVGALYDGWSCDLYCRMDNRRYREFWAHLPIYLLVAIAISEAVSWGLFRKLFPVKQ